MDADMCETLHAQDEHYKKLSLDKKQLNLQLPLTWVVCS